MEHSIKKENKGKGSKLFGKIILCAIVLVLAVFLAATSYIGGQDKIIERYFSSVCSGDLKSNGKALGIDNDFTKEQQSEFKAAARSYFTDNSAFSGLESTDIISCKVEITERRMISPTIWVCVADISFFCGKMYSVEHDMEIALIYDGKWSCEDVLSLNDVI